MKVIEFLSYHGFIFQFTFETPSADLKTHIFKYIIDHLNFENIASVFNDIVARLVNAVQKYILLIHYRVVLLLRLKPEVTLGLIAQN